MFLSTFQGPRSGSSFYLTQKDPQSHTTCDNDEKFFHSFCFLSHNEFSLDDVVYGCGDAQKGSLSLEGLLI